MWLDNDVVDKSHVDSGRAVAGESSGEESLFLPRHHQVACLREIHIPPTILLLTLVG
jgi:hypothetical protein